MATLLSRLRARPHAATSANRRISHRYPAIENQSWLGWWEGDEFRQIAARIEDISQTGGLLAVDSPVPQDQLLWFRLELPLPTDWIEIKAVRTLATKRLGIEFPGSCPYELFKMMRMGTREVGTEDLTVTPEFDTRIWR